MSTAEELRDQHADGSGPPADHLDCGHHFTDRAGAELRHRLREKVTKRLAKGTDSPANLQLLAAALQDLDAAVIGTIHSFAQRILRTHALSARLPIAFAPATGADAADDERSRVRFAINHVRASLDPRDLSLLAAYGLAPVDLLEVLQRLDAQGLRLHDAAFSQGGTDLDDLCAAAADGFHSFLLAARADCGDPADRLMVAFEERVPPVITLLRHADPAELAACRAAIEGTHPVFKLGNVGAAPAWGPGGAKARRDLLKELSPILEACLLAPLEGAVPTAFAQAWPVMREHREDRTRGGVVTFDELLSRTRDLIRDDRGCRALVHSAFPVVLVDEFQDTDPVQWELIRLITSDPLDPSGQPLPGRLIVVGDPKKAIYSFRGADIDTYTGALAGFGPAEGALGSVFELTTNCRSVAPVIGWVNRVFAAAMSGSAGQVSCRDLDVRHRPKAAEPGPAVTVLQDPEHPAKDDGSRATGVVDSTTLEPVSRLSLMRWMTQGCRTGRAMPASSSNAQSP